MNIINVNDDINAYLKEEVKKDYRKSDNRNTEKTHANVKKIIDVSNEKQLRLLLNPSSLFEKNYILLDSKNRIPTYSESISKYSWNFSNDAIIKQGNTNMVGYSSNLISMKLMTPVITKTANYTINNMVMILIHEFSAQSHIVNNDIRYHFMTKSQNGVYTLYDNRNKILNIEDVNDGIFNFNKPINNINTVSISYYQLGNLLVFNPDRYYVTFTIDTSVIVLQLPEVHGLTAGNDLTVSLLESSISDPVNNSDMVTFLTNHSHYEATIPSTTTLSLSIARYVDFGIRTDTGSGIVFIDPYRNTLCLELTFLK